MSGPFRLFVTLALASGALVCCRGPLGAADDLGLRVPDGFEVSLYADDALAHDIFSMTVDARGRVVVAGAGYVKILHDTDGDGRADRASLFSSVPASGAHGMYFDGPDLICTGDNSVMRLRDADGDGVADGPPEVWTELRHPEHGANGLVRGPDGCYWLIGGNDAGISERQITMGRSPIKHPRCGGIVRFSPEGKPLDVFADGFRNPYDLDFDARGHLLTVDSDGERDHHLPWYAPTRLFDVAQGMGHGWLLKGWTRGWNRPASFFDNVERMVEIGRGSPTGVVVYRHHQFPERYRGGVFAACWTLGRVYYFPLDPSGATCASKLEIFMETTGDVGFAPCDLAVGPQGELFVAIGGRQTRGSVFRVRSTRPLEQPARSPLLEVLAADQPLASWSRARWVPMARKLDKAAFEAALGDESLDAAHRVRAVEVLVELFGGLDEKLAGQWANANDADVRTRVAWALGRGQPSSTAGEILARLTSDADPRVERAAWEALATSGHLTADAANQPNWRRGLTSRVRRVRAAAIVAARNVPAASYRDTLSHQTRGTLELALRLAALWIKQPELPSDGDGPPLAEEDFQTCLETLDTAGCDSQLQIEAVRLMQIALGDLRTEPGKAEVYTGYRCHRQARMDCSLHERMVRKLAAMFPTSSDELNRELARVLGMLDAEHPALLPALARQWSAGSSVEDDLHYLIVSSLLGGPRTSEVTSATAGTLLALHRKLAEQGQFASRNWPFRVGEAFDELLRRDPALATAVVESGNFGRVEHTLFAERLPTGLRDRATRILWSRTVGDEQPPTAELISLAGCLPQVEARTLLDSQWEQAALRDAIVLALARAPRAADRSKFVEALASPQPQVVGRAARALMSLGMASSAAEMAAALLAFKHACGLPRSAEPRPSLVALLEFWTEGSADVDENPDPTKDYLGWFEMFEQCYPHEAATLQNRPGGDAKSWHTRLAAIDWSGGQPERGRGVFERRACHRCHQVSGHLGPELRGAVSRMSRDDLFTAIIDPNLEVSPAFHTTIIATKSGQVYHGVIVYESPEATLLQTGPDTTVRITDAETASLRPSKQSLMPTGLLDSLSDQDLGDLYSYLRTLANH